jgi:glycerol-1-phosphate dehydrogenase [NAD(P)+]
MTGVGVQALRGLVAARTIDVPRLLQVHRGALAGLPAALVGHFEPRRVLVASGAGSSRELADAVAAELAAGGVSVVREAGLEGSLDEAARLLGVLDDAPVSLVVAIGGGRPIDVAKLAASRAGADFVAVPTILSHDGMASPVASLVAPDGRRRSIGARMPAGVVIDVDIVARAPERYLRAGIGDLSSNLTAVEDWRGSHQRTGEGYDEFAASIALLGSQAALEVTWPLLDDDIEAVARGLVMSGLAMEVAGSSRPCSGTEHLISHALDEVRGTGAGLHGEQVAIGVILTSFLRDSPLRPRILRLFERVGIPLTLDGWELDESVLVEAVQRAPSTRPGRHTFLSDLDLSTPAVRAAIRAAFSGTP